MAKLKSSLTNMLLSLTLITLVAAGLLAGIYSLTKDTIAATNAAKQQAAIIAVLPQVEGLTIAAPIEAEGITIFKAKQGDNFAGAAVKVAENGFGGIFHVMVASMPLVLSPVLKCSTIRRPRAWDRRCKSGSKTFAP